MGLIQALVRLTWPKSEREFARAMGIRDPIEGTRRLIELCGHASSEENALWHLVIVAERLFGISMSGVDIPVDLANPRRKALALATALKWARLPQEYQESLNMTAAAICLADAANLGDVPSDEAEEERARLQGASDDGWVVRHSSDALAAEREFVESLVGPMSSDTTAGPSMRDDS